MATRPVCPATALSATTVCVPGHGPTATAVPGNMSCSIPTSPPSTAMSACIARFGRNPYFMRRCGETPMPPSEQAFIRSLLKQVGAPDDLDFDAFEERISWNDD